MSGRPHPARLPSRRRFEWTRETTKASSFSFGHPRILAAGSMWVTSVGQWRNSKWAPKA